MAKTTLPKRDDLLWPTLKVLEQSGGSASIEELESRVSDYMNISPEALDVPHGDGSRSEFDYRLAWARTNLKYIEAVDNSARGVWSITDTGRKIGDESAVRKRVSIMRKKLDKKRKNTIKPGPEEEQQADDEATNWQDELLSILRTISPAAFERLCQRVLRESGFIKVEVTGKSGDGGIDGTGILRIELTSFHIRFQCKRYSGSVGAPEIRDFRGAMDGRTDKGLFMTTGRFTADAEQESVRPGAQAIDLIDGTKLTELLKSLELGVSTEQVETVTIHPDFFSGL